MNGNFNSNGQFGGWGPQNSQNMGNPYGYNPYGNWQNPYNEEYFRLQNEKKNDKKILKSIGSSCGIAIIVYFVGAILLSTVFVFLSSKNPLFDVFFEEGMISWAYSFITTLLFIGMPFAVMYLILKKKKITGILPLGTSYNKKASACLVAIFLPITVVSTIIINYISFFIQTLLGIEFTSGMGEMTVNSVWDFILMTLFIAVAPAILEEVAIRGILLQPLRRYGDFFAIVCSAVIFSLLHGNMVQVPFAVVAGIFLGYVAVSTGSLWPSIILHFLNNFYSLTVSVIADKCSETVSTVLTLAIIGLFIVAGAVAFVIFKRMNYRTTLAKGVKTLKTDEKIKALFVNAPMIIALLMMIGTTLTSIS